MKAIDPDVINTPTYDKAETIRKANLQQLADDKVYGDTKQALQDIVNGFDTREIVEWKKTELERRKVQIDKRIMVLDGKVRKAVKKTPEYKEFQKQFKKSAIKKHSAAGANWDVAATAHEKVWAVIPKKK